MKIAIDVSQIVYGTGVSVYTKLLVENLLKIDKENKYVLFGGTLRQKNTLQNFFDTRVYPIPPTLADFIWNRLHILSIERLVGEVDVYHSSDWAQAPSSAFKVTTVHDLAPILFPGETDPKIVAVHKKRLSIVKKEVNKVIVPSLSTKIDLVNFGVASGKIVVIPEAATIDDTMPSKEKIENTLNKLNISEPFLLAVGSNPRKNIKNTVKAFLTVKNKVSAKQLVVVGRNTSNVKPQEGVIFTGYVSDEDLKNLYFGAKALVYASLYEGFGIPILNAFKAGCPVVTSQASSMPELAGDAAVMVNPNDVNSIAVGIQEVLTHKEKYIKKGRAREKIYNWETVAKETLEVYKESQK